MSSRRPRSWRRLISLAGSILMLSALPTLLTPSIAPAEELHRYCYCEDDYCQVTGGTEWYKWCCQGEQCGCSLYISGCIPGSPF